MLKYLGFSLQHVSAMSAPIYTADSVSLRTESIKWCKMMEIEGAAGGLIAEVAALLTRYGKERELLRGWGGGLDLVVGRGGFGVGLGLLVRWCGFGGINAC